MRPKDPNKAEQIRASALELFAAEGFDGFSMQKLAKAAGVSPATLYIHFQDKDDLIYQLYREQMVDFGEELLKDFGPDLPFAKGLRIQWENRLRWARARPRSKKFLEQILYSPYHSEFSRRTEDPFRQAMGAFVSNAVRRKEILDFGCGGDPKKFPKEIYWALAYAPLEELIRYEREDGGPGSARRAKPFRIDEQLLDTAFRRVLRSLTP
jgi:AcrR family transcriptional regulator